MNKETAVQTAKLKEFAFNCGVDLAGIADLALLEGLQTEPADLLKGYVRAISLGIRLADGVIDGIDDAPTPIYQQHYAKVNLLLDDIALRISKFIQDEGGRAVPIPASQLLDKTQWTSYISHKAVAIAAGLGWQGKSLLLVNPNMGPRVRLVTVLTDLPFGPDKPIKNLCAECTECVDACPAKAIKNVNTNLHYSSRNDALHFDRCVEQVTQNNPKLPFIDSSICGVCIRACPWGRRNRKKAERAVDI